MQVINGTVQNDARGSVIQFINTVTNERLAYDEAGHYTGNILTDAQIMVAKAIHDKVVLDPDDQILQIGANTIGPDLIDWAAEPTSTFEPSLRCNGDRYARIQF